MPQQSAAKTPEQQPPPQAVTGALGASSDSAPSDSHIFDLQQVAGNRAVSSWLQAGLRPPDGSIQRKSNDPSGDPAEQQADRAAEEAVKQPGAARKPLIVDDEVRELQPGQMRKSEFLGELRTSACSAAEEALAGTMWSMMGCPHIDRWINHYSKQSSQHLERSLLKFAPEASSVRDAGGYLPIVRQRLQAGIEQWKQTGEVTGVPEEFSSEGMPGVTAGGLIGSLVGGAVSAIGSAVSGAVSGLASGAAGTLSGLGQVSFKEREGGAIQPDDPAAIQAQLGSGHALDSTLKSQMESAYGADFSGVRIHTDGTAHELSDNLNARAFTIGNDIAFGTDEYHPGTIVGDALIAHELAHVVQQGGSSSVAPVASPQSKGGPTSSSGLEADADLAAAGAVVAVWGGGARLRELQTKARPRRRSGLQLQRCSGTKQAVKQPPQQQEKKVVSPEEEAQTRFRSAKLAAREEKFTDANKSLRELGDWVSTEERKQNRPEITAVVGLEPKLRDNASKAAIDLKAIGPTFDAKGLDAVVAILKKAVEYAASANKYRYSDDQGHKNAMRRDLGSAGDRLDDALAALEKTNDSVNGYKFWQEIEQARKLLVAARAGGDATDTAVQAFAAKIKKINEAIHELQNKYQKYPASIARIAFVVQYFVALNTPDFEGRPSADEIKKFKGTLHGSLSDDFNVVFGGGNEVRSPFDVFIQYADILEKQLSVLDKMSAAKKPAKTPIPAQAEVEGYFESLVNEKNEKVREAYQDYARGYFYHRVITRVEDMAVKDVADLYKRDLSIAGTRPLVCSGYAILGAHLLTLAGGKVSKFITGVRATDDDIRNDRIAVGHAIVVITRKGKTLVVSNDSIYDSETKAFESVWGTAKTPPRYEASGPTNNAALDALRAQLAKKM